MVVQDRHIRFYTDWTGLCWPILIASGRMRWPRIEVEIADVGDLGYGGACQELVIDAGIVIEACNRWTHSMLDEDSNYMRLCPDISGVQSFAPEQFGELVRGLDNYMFVNGTRMPEPKLPARLYYTETGKPYTEKAASLPSGW